MRGAIATVVVWAAHFALIYGSTALACAQQAGRLVPWIVGVATALALAALGAIAIPAARRAARSPQLAHALPAGLGALAALAVLWEASSLFGVSACG